MLPVRFADPTPIELRDGVRSTFGHMIEGTPEEVVEQMRAYTVAGLYELMMDWFDGDDLERPEVLAADVLPQLAFAAPPLERV